MKLVSVIIPTYKRAEYLKRAIDSVLNQTYKNVEIIVVDDNDPNTTFRAENEKLMQQYSKCANVKYIKHEKNKNGSAARNTGIRAAQGDYITFLDDDDFFLKKRIETLVDALDSNKNYDCAYTSMIIIANKKIIKYNQADRSGNFLLDALKCKSFFGTGSNLFFRKSAIEKVGYFDEKFIRNQDIEYIIRYFNIGDALGINKLLVVKCNDDRSNTQSFEKMLGVKETFFNTFGEIIDQQKEKNEIYYTNYESLLRFAISDKNNVKKLLDIMSQYKENNKKIYIKILFKKVQRRRSFIWLDSIIKNHKNKRRILPEIKEEIFKILNSK